MFWKAATQRKYNAQNNQQSQLAKLEDASYIYTYAQSFSQRDTFSLKAVKWLWGKMHCRWYYYFFFFLIKKGELFAAVCWRTEG